MNFETFWAMGGYAAYVWPAYAITTLVLVLNVIWPIIERKRWLRQQVLRQKREQSS